jgi:uncharacterized membrane protein YphA (DoxX/SURF4 family)
MIDVGVVASGLMAWWGCACRIGQMSPARHRLAARLWHWAAGALALLCVALVLVGRGDPYLGLATTATLLAYLLLTLREWADGPPAWTWRRARATLQRSGHGR